MTTFGIREFHRPGRRIDETTILVSLAVLSVAGDMHVGSRITPVSANSAIVNISSRAADIGSAGEWVHYAASKEAIDTFTLGLARELATEGIRVNAVAPGLIDTEIHAANGDHGRLERLSGSIPMRRAGQPREVSEAVLWLLSPASSYVKEAILDVGGEGEIALAS